ncbi:hypothetical protein Tco_1428475 [Tanacetum coccineum]
MGQDCNFTGSGFKDVRTVPGDGVAIPSDAVRTYKRRRQELCDGFKTCSAYGVVKPIAFTMTASSLWRCCMGNSIVTDDSESDTESYETPLVSPFLNYDDESDDEEVINELNEYGNAGNFHQGLENMGMNLVAIVRDVYVFVGSFTYVTDFVVLEDIWEFIVSNMADIVMGRPFRAVSQCEYDCVKGLISFTRIFDTYIYLMPRTIPRLKSFHWSKVPPILELNQRDLMGRIKYSYEKNKFMYKNWLGPEYQVDESMKEWLICRHVGVDGIM